MNAPTLRPAEVTATGLKTDILRHLELSIGKDMPHAVVSDWRKAVSLAVRDRMIGPWFEATRETYAREMKRVYYLSMEFLIGRLLEDSLVNLGLYEVVEKALKELGQDIREIFEDEPDAALGNGGLGRLAACFMDSMATIGCPAYGYGIRYEHGLFRQRIEAGRQLEEPETWLARPNPWEFQRPEVRFRLGFGGHVEEKDGKRVWHPDEAVTAAAFDTPVVGWQGRWGNTLRLWAAEPTEVLDLARFNYGDHTGAAEREALARSLSRVLYPDDTTESGKALRLKQEYFFTAASLADILARHLRENKNVRDLPKFAAIQLNDTHPAIAGPELIRLLVDDHGLKFDEAMKIARATLSYTNHTLLPEALEKWSEGLMWHLLPRHMEIIGRIDDAHYRANKKRLASMIDHGHVKMGDLAFVMAHKVNGVSALHSELMKKTVFEGLHKLHPEKIVNQTNGVTPRRWLRMCNPGLSGVITEAIGEGWESDLERLEELRPLADDTGFQDAVMAVKRANKADLAKVIDDLDHFTVDPSALFDTQVKRIHEYKRQHLNILQTIAHWKAIHDAPNADWVPRVKIFAGKAAPGYHMAKDIIRLINEVAANINDDPVTKDLLQVVFLPNYNVSLAEKIIPGTDLSEQISTAGKEASGTGNMKFALNGALTIGTLDGANVEIREHVGAENFFLFGLEAHEVAKVRANPNHAMEAIRGNTALARSIECIAAGRFAEGDPAGFHGLAENLRHSDYFLVCSDFADYCRAQADVDSAYRDARSWARMSVLNIAGSGWFSSDRTIRGYMRDIWGAQAAF